MTIENAAPILISAAGVAGCLVLLMLRIRRNGFSHMLTRRWLLIDFLLVIMAIEAMLDAITDVPGADVTGTIHTTAVVLRGMSTAGILALLATFPGHHPKG